MTEPRHAYPGFWQHLRTLWHAVLGMNRRNADYLVPLNDPSLIALVDNKAQTKEQLAAAGIAVPPTIAVWRDRRAVQAGCAALAGQHACVLKPGRGSGGNGILIVGATAADGLTLADGTRLAWDAVQMHCIDILDGRFSLDEQPDLVLVEERIVCAPQLRALCTNGLPDFRIVQVHGVPLLAMLRVPTSRSGGRANLHAGGLGVGIDIEHGVTRHGIFRNFPIRRHPDTQAVLEGVVIPEWEALLQVAAASYAAIPLGFMGVDLVLDAARGPLVLELNARPGLQIQLASRMAFRPLLEELTQYDVTTLTPAERIAVGRQLYAAHRME